MTDEEARSWMNESRRESRWLIAAIVVLALLRLWMMATHPLTDTTEARYGELARVTAEGDFWLMPHMTPTEPFFAKPPLSTWLAAAPPEAKLSSGAEARGLERFSRRSCGLGFR